MWPNRVCTPCGATNSAGIPFICQGHHEWQIDWRMVVADNSVFNQPYAAIYLLSVGLEIKNKNTQISGTTDKHVYRINLIFVLYCILSHDAAVIQWLTS